MHNVMDTMIETVKPIFAATQTITELLLATQPGIEGRQSLKEIVQMVASSLNVKPSEVAGLVEHFLHNTEALDLGYVARGKFGGWIPGPKPMPKTTAAKKASTAPVNAAAVEAAIEELAEGLAEGLTEETIDNEEAEEVSSAIN